MARRSQCSSAGDNPNHPNYLPPHYREEYRLAIDALVEEDLEGYYQFLQKADVVDFLCTPEIQHIQNSVHIPHQSGHPEQHFLEVGEDGSSDTYWPLHSDLDAPGLDLGWPQMHHFLGPTEVTTLVNPPEPDMPSIKDQARRLIKNAQQVIAIAMDMFTDVDMFADILNAAMRNVAVYVILDELNAHHFVDMVSNCRVNLQSIQFLRVRTVPGITYQCRSGKSFKGQMMDRFLLTDCRAVLSGNYSFMWSYEKLHRCMAHLFLGQLVTTFDEEFRILYAQSQPLIIENMPGPMEGLGHSQKRQYPSERRPLYREPKKFLDTGPPAEWARHSYDEGDWGMPHKKQDQPRGPADLYSRFPSQQLRMDPPFDQGSSRTPMMENPAFKRHSYAEGVHGRYSTQFLPPQGMPDSEFHGRRFTKGQQPHPGPGREADYTAHDKFWNQDYLSTDQYPEPGLPQDLVSPDGFDPVLNYLSSAEPVDFDQGSEKLLAADMPFGSAHPRRPSLGQPYACQTSPTPSNPTEQKRFFQDFTSDRKDPAVKRGLRNWRISSYLSAYDNPGEEGLPMAPPQASDPFEEPSYPIQQTASRVDLSLPKIPNVREFKVPAVPRASHIPSYVKTLTKEQPKQAVEEPAPLTVTKTTPTPSESSSTTDGEKIEEAEQREPKLSALRREDSFRRKYNAAQPRSSRLRSSLIFSSLDQQNTSPDTKSNEQDEEGDKNEPEQAKLPILSQLLGQRRSSSREPIEWSRFIKSATLDHSSSETSKPGEGDSKAGEKDKELPEEDNSKELSENPKAEELLKQPDVEQIKTNEAASQPPLFNLPAFVDMSDPDNRLMFFKELAAKRKAAKAAEAEKNKEKSSVKPSADVKNEAAVIKEGSEANEPTANTAQSSERSVEKSGPAENVGEVVSTLSKEDSVSKESLENMASASEGLSEQHAAAESAVKTVSTEVHKSDCPSLDATEQTVNLDNYVKNADSDATPSIKPEQTKVSSDSKISEQKNSSTAEVLPEKEKLKLLEEPTLSNPAGKAAVPGLSPAPTDSTSPNLTTLVQGTEKSENLSIDSTSEECHSVKSSAVVETASPVLDSNPPDSVQSDTNVSSSLLPKPDTVSQISSSNPSVKISSSDTSTTLSDPKQAGSSDINTKISSSSPAHSILPPNVSTEKTQETVSSLPQESGQSAVQTPQKSETLNAQTPLDSSLQVAAFEASSAIDSAQRESEISSDVHAASEPSTSSLQSTTTSEPEEVSGVSPSPKESQKDVNNAKDEVCESEKHTLKVEKADSDLHQNVSKPENGDSVNDISESVNSVSAPQEVSVSTKESKESEKDECLSQNSVPKTEGISASEVVSYSGNDASESEISSLNPVADDSEASVSTEDIEAINVSPGLSPSVSDSGSLPVKSPAPEPDLKETSTVSTPELTPTHNLPSETASSVKTDIAVNVSQSETTASSQDAPKQAAPPSDLEATGLNVSLQSISDTVCPASETPTDSDEGPQHPSGSSPSSPAEPTSKEAVAVNPPSSTPDVDTSESQTSKPAVASENEKPGTDEEKSSDTKSTNKIEGDSSQDSVSSGKTNDQAKQIICPEPAEVTTKQPKSSQPRYHASTANVLSSSNLRDDTKLLLEQISAQSQTRGETTKESPVTDDEKEDEADKLAKREKERGIRSLNKGQDKPAPEREKLLERIQSMRKERRVYSRFEV
ncbi:protein FAM83H isoform X1 [Salarias fasciatus]|uniref:protein FAM83H isoform X1 n=1 Tax=Salarias fasciatus TaxID=181472 RepID=UPI00117670FA|nr:protein FAM83H-like isoform X1 [Salarias fasciatus]